MTDHEQQPGAFQSFKAALSDLYFSLQKEKFPRLVITIFIAVMIAAALMVAAEGGKGRMLENDSGPLGKFGAAIYYGMVTITTVGYGDYSPRSAAGRFLAIVLMLFGITFFSMFTATIASIFVERKIREGRGLIKLSNISEHIVICGWKKDLAKLLGEIMAINKNIRPADFVVVANITPDTIDVFRQQNPNLRDITIIRGEHFNDNILKQANIAKAKSVYIVADESYDASRSEIDSKTVMAAMAIGAMTKNAYITAELLDPKFTSYLESAHVSEIIFSSEYSRMLIANASVSVGIAKVINELLDVNTSSWLYTEETPQQYIGGRYGELKNHYLENNLMIIGLVENVGSYFERKNEALRTAQKTANISELVKNLNDVKRMESNKPVINPPDDYTVKTHSFVILINSDDQTKVRM